jgi:hypothetical protein
VEAVGRDGVEGVELGCVSRYEFDVGGFGVVKKSKGYFIEYSKEIDWESWPRHTGSYKMCLSSYNSVTRAHLIDGDDPETGVAVPLFRSPSLICLALLCLALPLL